MERCNEILVDEKLIKIEVIVERAGNGLFSDAKWEKFGPLPNVEVVLAHDSEYLNEEENKKRFGLEDVMLSLSMYISVVFCSIWTEFPRHSNRIGFKYAITRGSFRGNYFGMCNLSWDIENHLLQAFRKCIF